MKQYFLLLLYCVCASSVTAQHPNNLIFFGGKGDGIGGSAYAISASNIFLGGQGDGAAYATNNLLPNAIYFGGFGDGFSNQSNNAQPNNIFFGSEGDGFSHQANVSIPNNIFSGGEGDGWSAIVLPLGPLPVELLSFSAEHAGEAHLVRWSTAAEINTLQFEVQRSADARNFHALGTVAPAGSASSGGNYRFSVNEPLSGSNFYRLKIIDNDGSFSFSNIVLLKNEGTVKISVFPNPAADLIHITIPASGEANNVKAFVYDGQGRMIMQTSLQTGSSNAIPVNNLPAGVYTIRSVINKQPVNIRFMKQK